MSEPRWPAQSIEEAVETLYAAMHHYHAHREDPSAEGALIDAWDTIHILGIHLERATAFQAALAAIAQAPDSVSHAERWLAVLDYAQMVALDLTGAARSPEDHQTHGTAGS